jgi:hypothetical protein
MKVVNIPSTKKMKKIFAGSRGIAGAMRCRIRHCERSEAIHPSARKMDCFVADAPRNDESSAVMAGLVPAIHVFLHVQTKNVDARDKPRA